MMKQPQPQDDEVEWRVSRKYFGTDGIRGRVGEGPISADFVLRLGNAYGHALPRRDWRNPVVIIGKDTRISELHVRGRAGSRPGRRRRRRAADGADADARPSRT